MQFHTMKHFVFCDVEDEEDVVDIRDMDDVHHGWIRYDVGRKEFVLETNRERYRMVHLEEIIDFMKISIIEFMKNRISEKRDDHE